MKNGYFYRQFETSPIWRSGYSQNENPEQCSRWATKTRLVGNQTRLVGDKTRLVGNQTRLVDNQNTFGGQQNTFGGQPKHVWWTIKHVWWATKRRCPPYELLPIKIGNSGYFYRQFETSPIWRGGYSQNENPERCNGQDDVKTANWDLDSL